MMSSWVLSLLDNGDETLLVDIVELGIQLNLEIILKLFKEH